MKRGVGIAAATLVAVVLLPGLLLYNGVSLRFAMPFIERQASAFLQRPVHLREAPYLQIDNGLRLTLQDVSVDNADWAGDQALLQLQDLKIRVNITSLFSPRIIVEDLLLDGLRIHLLTDAAGRSNLPEFASDTPDVSNPPESNAALPFALKHVRISNVQLDQVNQATQRDITLVIDALSQDEVAEDRLSLQGSGSLQDKPWSLDVAASGIASILSGENLFATVNGNLGELTLTGSYQLPNLRNRQDLTLNAVIDGPVPDRIAALSPLLVANEPAQLTLTVTDVDPGLSINLAVDLTHLKMQVRGSVDRPDSGDGLDLSVAVDADSLPNLAAALGLGETPDVPLAITTQMARTGERVELHDLKITAGAHRIEGDLLIPAFPDTAAATLDFTATGPEFAFYQRLLEQTPNLAAPYVIAAKIRSVETGGESLTANAAIGDHRLRLSGLLNNYPSYRGSDIEFTFNSPSLRTLAKTADIDLPDSPVTLNGQITVSEEEIITISDLRANTMGISAGLTGQLKSYPEFNDMDFRLTADLASLSDFTRQFTQAPSAPGDLPVRFSIDARGAAKNLSIINPQLIAGGLKIQSSGGALRFNGTDLQSDLRLEVELAELPALLGGYAPEGLPAARYTFALLPQISEKTVSVSLEDLKGPGVTGSARARMTRDLRINEQSHFSADLQLNDLSQLLPEMTGYTAPGSPLNFHAETRPGEQATRMEARLSGADAELLLATLDIPDTASNQDPVLSLRGSGPDLRLMGTLKDLPDRALPYSIDMTGTLQSAGVSIDLQKLEVAGTHIEGVADWHSEQRALTADLQVPTADLQFWMGDEKPADVDTATNPGKSKKDRLIPDIPLPLALLEQYRIDLALVTGPLGLVDPVFANQSLIDALRLHLSSEDGKATLRVDELRGSRGVLTGNIAIVAREAGADFSGAVYIDDFPVGFIAPVTVFANLPLHSLKSNFSARGGNVRELAATLDGDFLIMGGAGRLEKISASFATESFTAQLFQTLLPMLKTSNPDMQVECTVLTARANQGVVTLDPGFVFRSEKLDLSAQGQIDLRSEKLKVTFKNRVRDGLGLSAASLITPYLEVSGTLAKPRLGLDIASSALNGGAAVASGGVTILARPLLDRLLPKTNPCEAALAQWNSRSN